MIRRPPRSPLFPSTTLFRSDRHAPAGVRDRRSARVISLQQLNSLPPSQFVAALAGVFERTPWVAERVAAARPFRSHLHLHQAMCAAVEQAGIDEQLALIRAHPELAGGTRMRGELTPESAREQQGAGLAACTPEEVTRLQQLNAAYTQRFGFPSRRSAEHTS